MIRISIKNNMFQIIGAFDFGYIGLYQDDMIQIVDEPDEVREWDIVTQALDSENCTDDELAAFIENYINELQDNIKKNIKQVNDNFLLRVFSAMEAVGNEFWKFKDLTISELLPENPENEVYQPNNKTMTELQNEYNDSPNDGSIQKTDVEALFVKLFQMFDLRKFIQGIEPECICLTDGYLSFQCSDKFKKSVLCSAYDNLDKNLRFTDWHNF